MMASLFPKQYSCRVLCMLLFCIFFILMFNKMLNCDSGPKVRMVPRDPVHYMYDDQDRAIPYDANMPLIFIGGMPRSGTTLMRVMLDSHPEIRCGEETRVIPRILGMRGQWLKSKIEHKRLEEAGLTNSVIDSAISSFIIEIIAKHGPPAPRLCNKDPFTLKSTLYLSNLFPNAKFLLMVRDGRAVIHSIISRKVTISGFDLKDFRDCMKKWNAAMQSMYSQCIEAGLAKCMPVYYEQLVLHPEVWIRKILKFLDVPFDERTLHHEDYMGKIGGISLSKTEKSTDQVIKPVNTEALTKWVGNIPEDVVVHMEDIAPMLRVLGYDPVANPPNYGKPDAKVVDNTLYVQKHGDFWKERETEVLSAKKAVPKVQQAKDEKALPDFQDS